MVIPQLLIAVRIVNTLAAPGKQVGPCAPFPVIGLPLWHSLIGRPDQLRKFFLIALWVKTEIAVQRGNPAVFQHSGVQSVAGRIFSIIIDIRLDLLHQVGAVVFPEVQQIDLCMLHCTVRLVIAGPVKFIVNRRCEQNYSSCNARCQICDPFPEKLSGIVERF